jgi:isoquinoline 1-oxidoreductase alpha subunit
LLVLEKIDKLILAEMLNDYNDGENRGFEKMINLEVNGTSHKVSVDSDTPLLWVLREQLGLMGTKYSCGIGECGACNVLIDGTVIKSCTLEVQEAVGSQITTIEGLQGTIAEALFKAWQEEDVPQCGYCQPGQIIQAFELLQANPNPIDDDIDRAMSEVLCRCGTYQHIRAAIHKAAKRI